MEQIQIDTVGWQTFFSLGGCGVAISFLLLAVGILAERKYLLGCAVALPGIVLLVLVFSYFDFVAGHSLGHGITARGVLWPPGSFEAAKRDIATGGIEAFKARAEREKLAVRYFPKQK